MKHLSFKPFKNWFGYTRSERRASFIILLITLLIGSVRFIIPDDDFKAEIITIEPRSSVEENIHNKGMYSNKSQKIKQIPARQNRPVINLNVCDSADLERLPGIGPVLSRRIIKYRNLLGGFVNTAQLREVYGLSDSTFNLVSGMVAADSSSVNKININKADFKQLVRFPYLEKYEVTSIIKFRDLKGKINSLIELVENKIISLEKAKKVRPYLEF